MTSEPDPSDHPLSVQSAPAGWVTVPREPTQEMVERAYEDADTIEERWAVMLAAAPPPPVSERTVLADLVSAWDDAQTDDIPQPLWGRLYAAVLAARAIVEPTND